MLARRLIFIVSTLLTFTACCHTPHATTQPAPLSASHWNQVAVEARLIVASDNFYDITGIPLAGNSVEVEPIDTFTLNLLIQATQADVRTVTITLPRFMLPFPGAGSVEEKDSLRINLEIAEALHSRLAITLKDIVPVPRPAQQKFSLATLMPPGKLTIPRGLPKRIEADSPATFMIRGVRLENDGTTRHLLILLRFAGIQQKEIENDLFGPGYDKPTTSPASP
jgi:hypothetical protein